MGCIEDIQKNYLPVVADFLFLASAKRVDIFADRTTMHTIFLLTGGASPLPDSARVRCGVTDTIQVQILGVVRFL